MWPAKDRKLVPILLNALAFQCAWWAIILFPGVWTLVVLVVFFCQHFIWVSASFSRESLYILVVCSLGVAFDSVFFAAGLMTHAGANVMPLWMIGMWLIFAATLRHSLNWLAFYPKLAIVLGAVVGPLSYLAGTEFTDVNIAVSMWLWALITGVFWSVFLPLMLYLQRFFFLPDRV